MRYILIIVAILFSTPYAFGQLHTAEYNLNEGESIMYFDSAYTIVLDKNEAESYRVFKLGIDNQSDGSVKQYYKSGKIWKTWSEASFIDFNNPNNWRFEGPSIQYYETGEKLASFSFVKNKIHGKYLRYYQSESVRGHANDTKGLIDSSMEFSEASDIMEVRKYNDGQLVHFKSFYPNGHIKDVANYENGKLEGIREKYYLSGEIKVNYDYSGGVIKQGVGFFKNGTIAYEFVLNKDGRMITSAFDVWGNVIWESNEFYARPTYSWLSNGNEVDNPELADYVRGTMWTTPYGDNGTFFTYVAAVTDGIQQRVIEKIHYTTLNAQIFKDGISYQYDKNGKISRVVNYAMNVKNGDEITYDSSGRLTSKITWVNGVADNWAKDCSGKECEYTYEADFSERRLAEYQGWKLEDSQFGIINIGVNNQYYMKGLTNEKTISTVNLPVSINEDFQLSTEVDTWHDLDNNGFGLICGFKNWDNYIILAIAANGYYQVEVVYKGIQMGMSEFEKLEKLDVKSTTKLNIIRLNGKLIFSINKQMVYSLDWPDLEGDGFGFYVGGSQNLLFDNFKMVKTANNVGLLPRSNNTNGKEWAGNGSGIILSKSGLVATNFHVIEDASEIELEFKYRNNIQSFNAKVLRVDEANDLAILKIDDAKFTGLSNVNYNFKSSTSLIGESVFALGYPKALSSMGKDIKFTDGKISSTTGFEGDVTSYQTTTPIQPGNSGGPLFDYHGNLIGINSAKIVSEDVDNVAYTIKAAYLKTLVESLNESIVLPSSNYPSSLSLTSKIELLSQYVTLIKVR